MEFRFRESNVLYSVKQGGGRVRVHRSVFTFAHKHLMDSNSFGSVCARNWTSMRLYCALAFQRSKRRMNKNVEGNQTRYMRTDTEPKTYSNGSHCIACPRSCCFIWLFCPVSSIPHNSAIKREQFLLQLCTCVGPHLSYASNCVCVCACGSLKRSAREIFINGLCGWERGRQRHEPAKRTRLLICRLRDSLDRRNAHTCSEMCGNVELEREHTAE